MRSTKNSTYDELGSADGDDARRLHGADGTVDPGRQARIHRDAVAVCAMFGIKGIGENGAIGPPAAICNAVNDALRPLGATSLKRRSQRAAFVPPSRARGGGGIVKPASSSTHDLPRCRMRSAISTTLRSRRVIAGGQSLGPMLNLRLAQPSHLIDISRIDDCARPA